MNIAIITICTGKYDIFFKDLYESSEKYFLNNHLKHYFVFTESNNIDSSENVTKLYQEKMGWPYDTMLRFKMFNSIKETLSEYDYIFFLNANMLFVDFVSDEVLPNEENGFLMGVNHPGFYNKEINQFPYERNPYSTSYIEYGSGKNYYQGCFNGGRSKEYLEMSESSDILIMNDLDKGIIPVWHDESKLNSYYKDLNVLTLDSGYAYPESVNDLPFAKKIIQRDKSKYGGHHFLRQ